MYIFRIRLSTGAEETVLGEDADIESGALRIRNGGDMPTHVFADGAWQWYVAEDAPEPPE